MLVRVDCEVAPSPEAAPAEVVPDPRPLFASEPEVGPATVAMPAITDDLFADVPPPVPEPPVTSPGTAAPVSKSSFATPLEATLSWFAAVNAKDRAAAVAHFVPADASMMNWGNGDTSTWSTFTRLRCKPLSSGAASATVYCAFDESQSPSAGNPDTFWTVWLARQPDDWRLHLAQASTWFDWAEFQYGKKVDLAIYVEKRQRSFEAFQRASDLYARVLPTMEQSAETPAIYQQWLNANLGASDLAFVFD